LIQSNLTENAAGSVFSEDYAKALSKSVESSEFLNFLLTNSTLVSSFSTEDANTQFSQVSKMIKSLSRLTDVERAVFFTHRDGFDTHGTTNLAPMFQDIDTALGSFATEMKSAGLWDDVVVLSLSDFGRTLTSNGAGTRTFLTGTRSQGLISIFFF
jgi:uncharacterized protein (DUF1501 family)